MNALREASSKAEAELALQLKAAEAQCLELKSQLGQSKSEKVDLESRLQAVRPITSIGQLPLANSVQAESLKSAANESKDAVQSELDDLLMVFGDLEEKVGKYKVGGLRQSAVKPHSGLRCRNAADRKPRWIKGTPA